MASMILVMGASGKTGRAVVAALADGGDPVRALVRHPSQVDVLRSLGAHEAIAADLRRPADVRRAAENVRAVYHICPNMHPEEALIGGIVVAAAREAGVEHFVLHSVLHPQTERMPHHWNKMRVEEALIESGIEFTILQPAPYMQNLLASWSLITEKGILRNPYPISTRLSLVDLRDVARAAAIVLAQPNHRSATYELAGTAPLAQTEVADILGRALGKSVHAEAEPIAAWQERARAAGLTAVQRNMLTAMFEFYANHGLPGNPNTLRCLLGNEPTSLAAFARRSMDEPQARRGTRATSGGGS